MLRVPLPLSQPELYLEPRFAGWPWWLQGLALTLLAVGPACAIIWLYRTELRVVGRLTALGLLVLRLLVGLAVALVVGWQPVLAQADTEIIPGRVLLALDCSASMMNTDAHRPDVEKLKLARGLGCARDLANDHTLANLIRSYERDGGLAENHPARPVLDAVIARMDDLTRLRQMQYLLAKDGADVLGQIKAKHQVELVALARDSVEVLPSALSTLGQTKISLGSAGLATDLRKPLEQALERAGGTPPLLGVVVLSDGQHNSGPTPLTKADELGQRGVPIFTVPFGTAVPPTDIAILAVTAPPNAFKGADVPIDARVRVTGVPAQELVIRLEQQGQRPLEERVRHDGTDRTYVVRFTPRLEQLGTHRMNVQAPRLATDLRPENNRKQVSVRVADDVAKVLLADGEHRWEYHYLASALRRDPAVQVTSVVCDQTRLGWTREADLRKLGFAARQLPTEADALEKFDAIILGDLSPTQLPAPDRLRIEKMVADSGKTLVLLVGKHHLPLAFREANDPLMRLLPILNPREYAPVTGFPLNPTAEGLLTPFLQLEPGAARWPRLPPHYWAIVGQPKPGAQVLAVADDPANPNQPTRAQDHAVIVRHNYGLGRVLFVGIDSTWRWRYRMGDTYHHRFWGQVIRWAASDRPLLTGNQFVRFGPRDPVYSPEQEVEVIVRLSELAKQLSPTALAGIRVWKQTDGAPEAVGLFPLSKRPGSGREFDGRLRDLPGGSYTLEVVIPELGEQLNGPPDKTGQPEPLRARFDVIAPDSGELGETTMNRQLLDDLASRSGGQLVLPEEASKLVELLTAKPATRTTRQEWPLGRSWWTFALVVSLLTLEWGVRKWVGLP
jgi:hypothetical protein